MSVNEHERHQLFTWFEEHMGSERAATMMSMLPPTGWGDVSTRRDLDEGLALLRRDLDEGLALLRRDLDGGLAMLRRDLDQHIAATRNDIDLLRHDVRQLEARLDADVASLRHDLREQLRTFGTWLFASQAAVIAAVSLLFAFR